MQWASYFSRKRASRDQDLDRELAFHIDALARDYQAAGMSPEQARRQARIHFGGREQVTQQLREVHISVLLETARECPRRLPFSAKSPRPLRRRRPHAGPRHRRQHRCLLRH